VLIQPREQILDIWRSVVNYAYQDGKWNWFGRTEPNSISDAELLLCILYPATNVPALRFDRPDQTARDVLDSLRGLGNDLDIAKVVVRALTEYMERYTNSDGKPIFPGGDYLKAAAVPLIAPEAKAEPGAPAEPGAKAEPEAKAEHSSDPETESADLELVDSYSMSVTLSLSTIGFLQVLRSGIRNEATLRQMDHLKELASQRLTAAMTGLLRSFSVRVFDYDSQPGLNLCRMVNQSRQPNHVVAERLSFALGDIRSRLREELSIGSGQMSEELDNPSQLFECGWSWGVVNNAAKIKYTEAVSAQSAGVAEDRPYLYFTGVALDGIEDLFTPRTRILGLLDETQQRLAQALQLRWELSLSFWTRIGTFDEARWPIEDVPWMTTDGIESDYYSLFVGSMVAQSIAARQSSLSASSLVRVGSLLEELANRGRITRRPLRDDPALAVHVPGIELRLRGSEKIGPQQAMAVASYSTLLLKRVVRLSSLAADSIERDRLIKLADDVWLHVLRRRMDQGVGVGLWDQPAGALPIDVPEEKGPSWYHTQRVVECMVAAAWAMDVRPRVSERMVDEAREYLVEAEHLFDQEQLYGRGTSGQSIRDTFHTVDANLKRARELLYQRPGTASVLAEQVLLDLDKLQRARVGDGTQE
jgi:hypothetical protein